tara:strand:+ start:745 stop:1026 length:282 start_codon:yes stop_codon:yes gene_type:complete
MSDRRKRIHGKRRHPSHHQNGEHASHTRKEEIAEMQINRGSGTPFKFFGKLRSKLKGKGAMLAGGGILGMLAGGQDEDGVVNLWKKAKADVED